VKVDHSFLQKKVDQYVAVQGSYRAFGTFLEKVLRAACSRLAPFSFVETRVKGIASFAEKVVRKQDKFRADPAYDITDHCGARVIARTTEERALICKFIRDSFYIDEKNSLDVKSRLNVDQFGYLSVHYVVSLDSSRSELEGVRYPRSIGTGPKGYRAEIQVRTMLEHVWADSLHDRLYKVAIQVPTVLQREAAGLAATIEATDFRLASLAGRIDNYLGHYSAYMTRARLAGEASVVEAARRFEPRLNEKAALTLRLGILRKHLGEMDRAIAEWKKAYKKATPARDAIWTELGSAFCVLHRKNPGHKDFKSGQRLLREVAFPKRDKSLAATPHVRQIQSEAAQRLAWSLSLCPGAECEARDCYRRSLSLAPDNPYYLAGFLEHEIYCSRTHEIAPIMRQGIERAIATCREHVAVGIELPRAHFAIGRLQLLIGEFRAALDAYLLGIRLLLRPDACASDGTIEEEIRFLERVNVARERPEAHEKVYLLLQLARTLFGGQRSDNRSLKKFKSRGAERIAAARNGNLLIIVGGAGQMAANEVERYAPALRSTLERCNGVVFSGGTKVGIPGLIGKISGELKKRGRKRYSLLAYLPAKFPRSITADEENYDDLISTTGIDFSETEVIQGWIDLIATGIDPKQVRLLGINGGAISAFEFRLALALGAKVGVVPDSGREAEIIFKDEHWSQDSNLLRLPLALLDSATVHAFLRPGVLKISEEKLDQIAQDRHEAYLSTARYSDLDPIRRKFFDLPDEIKRSNRRQLLYFSEILGAAGYVVRELKKDRPAKVPSFSKNEIERMAELEHGRWNIERLESGWKYGEKKDPARKQSPSILPWDELKDGEDGAKRLDREAIAHHAKLLAEAGYEIVKAPHYDK
jgi:ppGpp synthetase/RelA/SpoT-type nucleotidyltranferase